MHLSLDKDAPLGRAIERHGAIVPVPILSALHHYLRADMIFERDNPPIVREPDPEKFRASANGSG